MASEPLTPAERELAEASACIHINGLLHNRIKQWASQPGKNTTIREAAENALWEVFGGLPSELKKPAT